MSPDQSSSSSGPTPRHGSRLGTGTLLFGLTLTGFLLRFFRLSHWGLEGDEIFTLRDSLTGGGWDTFFRRVLFSLNYHVVSRFVELDELGLRLLPALFGVVAIPAIFFFGRRLLGSGVGLAAATIVTFQPWHLYFSQYARHFSLVFFFSIWFPIALYLAVRDKSLLWTVLGVIGLLLAIQTHQSSGLLLGGWVLWFLIYSVMGVFRKGWASAKNSAISAFVTALAIGLGALKLWPNLQSWMAEDRWEGFAGPVLLMSYGNWLTATLSVFALSGLIILWRTGKRDLALLFTCSVGFPVVFLALAGYYMSVSVGYLFTTAPLVILLAGYFVAYLGSSFNQLWARNLVMATVLLAVIGDGAPTMFSQYLDGSRPDFRAAAEYINDRGSAGDFVLPDQLPVFRRYSDGPSVFGLQLDPVYLSSRYEEMAGLAGSEGALWVVIWMASRAGFDDRALGPAQAWIDSHCKLDKVVGRARLDYKSNLVYIYPCQAAGNQPDTAD